MQLHVVNMGDALNDVLTGKGWGKKLALGMLKENSSFSALLKLILSMIAVYTHDADGKEVLERVPALKKAAAPFSEKYKIRWHYYQTLVDMLEKGKGKTDAYEEALCDLRDDLSDHKALIFSDTSVSYAQMELLRAIMTLMNTGEEKHITAMEKKLGFLHDPQLNKWYSPTVGDQKPIVKELNFLVKKVSGRDDHRLKIDEVEGLKKSAPKRLERYKQLRKQASDIFKNLVRNTVRESGKPNVPISMIRRAVKEAGLDIHSLDNLEGFEGRMDEDGKIYTKEGKLIQGVPGPGYRIEMNPNYDPAKDDANYFKVTPNAKKAGGYTPTPERDQHFYTTDYKKAGTQKKFTTVEDMQAKVKPARAKWLEDLNSPNPVKAAYGAIVELLYSYQLRIGGVGNKTDGQQTYGLTTLQVRHVRFLSSGSVKLAYEGKKAMEQQHIVKPNSPINRRLIEVLQSLTKDKKPNAYVFLVKGDHINAQEVNHYIRSRTGLKTTAHKFRHLAGTTQLMKLIQDKPLKKDATQSEAEKYFKERALEVGKQLGHFTANKEGVQKVTSSTAIKNYINPAVGKQFFENRKLRIPKWLQFAG